MVIIGLDHVDQFPEIVRHHEAGTIPPTVMWGACPTVFDPSQAPDGMHTAFMWEKLPYALGGDPRNWDTAAAAHGRAMLDLWRKHAPNLEGAVIDSFTRSALDTERSLPNMREGDLLGRRVHQRPDRIRPAVSRRGRLPHPCARTLSLRLEQPPGRQRHRPARIQRGADHPRRSRNRRAVGARADFATAVAHLATVGKSASKSDPSVANKIKGLACRSV